MSLDYLYIGLLKNSRLGLVEISQEGTNYRRIEMGPEDWHFQVDHILNIETIQFNMALKTWGLVTHFGVFDSLDKGNILAVGQLEFSIIVVKNDQPQFEIGTLSIMIEALELEIKKTKKTKEDSLEIQELVETVMEWIGMNWTPSMIKRELQEYFDKELSNSVCNLLIRIANRRINKKT